MTPIDLVAHPRIASMHAATAANEPLGEPAATPLVSAVDPRWLVPAPHGAAARRLPAGTRLWRAGQRADHFVVIERGIVEIEQSTAGGDTVLLGLFGPGDCIGLTASLARGTYVADAIALTGNVEATRIQAAPLLDALPGSAALAIALNDALLRYMSILGGKIEIVSAGSVPRRLAAMFLHLARRFGRPRPDGSTRIDVGMTREQIGEFVSARVETVSRIVSRWQKAGWLVGGRDSIEIARVDMLRRILGG